MAQNIPTAPHPPMGELAWLGGSTGIMPAAAASALGDALNAVATAAHACHPQARPGPDLTWPLIGRLGLARYLAPAPAG